LHFWNQLRAQGLDARMLGGKKVAAIGPATAKALEERGIYPDFVPEKYVAESVVEGLLERGIRGTKILLPRACEAREVLPQALRGAGCEVDVLPVYETVLAGENKADVLTALEAGDIHCLTFTSSSTVENFFSLLEPELIRTFVDAGLRIASIGPITTKTIETYGFSVQIQPDEYTIPALADALGRDLA
ncbi:MAG: uroporphyrinogen-III synthase, partial [Desulfoplanes sp.]